MALRLANFISAFLQVADPNEVYSGKRVADKALTEDQMIGETLALLLGDTKIFITTLNFNLLISHNELMKRINFLRFSLSLSLVARDCLIIFGLHKLFMLNNFRTIIMDFPTPN